MLSQHFPQMSERWENKGPSHARQGEGKTRQKKASSQFSQSARPPPGSGLPEGALFPVTLPFGKRTASTDSPNALTCPNLLRRASTRLRIFRGRLLGDREFLPRRSYAMRNFE